MASTGLSQDASSSTPRPVAAQNLTSQEKRATMHKMIQAGVTRLPALPDTLEEYDIHIPVQDGWQSRTKIVRPKAIADSTLQTKQPLIVHFYGGGMIVGEPEQVLSAAREFASTYGAVVALPSYRLVPDVRWPVPFKDGWDVLVWLSLHAETDLGANLDAGFIVGGISAGGCVAAACGGIFMFPNSKEANEAPSLAKPLTGQFLCVPGLAVDEIVPAEYKKYFTALEDNKDVVGLNTAAVKQVLDGLQCTDYSSLWFSPVATIAREEPVNKVPVYLEHCMFDALRDDVTVYSKLLESRGVQTKIHLFPEDGHNSWTVLENPTKSKNPTIKEAQMAGMKWLLSLS